MQATFAAGATVSMVFREPRRHHKVKATVAGATDAAILLDLGEAGARPAPRSAPGRGAPARGAAA